MRETPGALEKLYSMLHDADALGLSRPARMRLVGIIGSLENEELDRFRSHYSPHEKDPSREDDRRTRRSSH